MNLRLLFFSSVLTFTVSTTSFANSGIVYELNQGTGYVFQGESWQGSLIIGYFEKPFDSAGNEFFYKIALRKDIGTVETTPITVGISLSQIKPASKMNSSSNILAVPVGIRHLLTKNLQLDLFVNAWALEEKYIYNTLSEQAEYDIDRSGKRYLGSGGIALSFIL